MDVLIHPRLPAPLRSLPKPESVMLFRNDETKEEREAREDIFGTNLSPADAPTMDVDQPPTLTQKGPNQGPPIQEPRVVPRPSLESAQPTPAHTAAAPKKPFGMGESFSTSFPDRPADLLVAPLASTAPVIGSHQAPISSTPFIHTAPPPTASVGGGPTSAPAVPSVWQGAVADEAEAEAEDEEMPEINIESDSE